MSSLLGRQPTPGTGWPGQGGQPGRLDLLEALTGPRRRQLPRWCGLSVLNPLSAAAAPPTAPLAALPCLHAVPAVAAAALAVTQAARPAPACRGAVLACSCHLPWRGTTPMRCVTPTRHHRPPCTGGAAVMGGSITSSNVAGGREARSIGWRQGGSSIPVWCGAAPLPLLLLLLDDSSSPCQWGPQWATPPCQQLLL